ncbi:40S ribosomal protein S12, mitochondrial [Folsomia candida]|uniref:40S ribosomal protein S12, mitochondrial n=1 Tax=Folsomia candida TaxID=158441 RepID=UPI000B8FBBCF|nr:40S ribosomal protein S12, mitochondrial [Folsomia candida]
MWSNSLHRIGRAIIQFGVNALRTPVSGSESRISSSLLMLKHQNSAKLSTRCALAHQFPIKASSPSPISPSSSLFQKVMCLSEKLNTNGCSRSFASLEEMHRWGGPHKKFRPPRKPLDGKPMLKGIVLKTLIKKPKKPNSANRKCVLVRLSNGKEAVAYVPGIGHNLQEHNIVLVRCGRLQDVPGVKLKCIRGKYDLAHVQKQSK